MTETGAGGAIMATREPRLVGTHCFGRTEPFVEARVVDDEGRDVPPETPGELLVRASRPRPAPPLLLRLPEGRDGDRGGLGRRLVPHRRRGAARRRRQPVLRRPQEERDPAQRREHLGGRGRERAEPASGGEGLGGRRGARRRCAATRCSPASSRASRSPSTRGRSSRPRSSTTRSASSPTSRRPGYVAFVDALPLTLSQKIQRGELRKLAQALPGDACCIDTRAMKKRQG